MASEIRVNKIINRSGLSTVTFTDDGAIVSGIVSATVYTGSGANLTNIPAGNLSGTLPAISGANLTGINTTFGNSSVNTSGIITATAFVPTTQGSLSHRNMIINGDQRIAQRGTAAVTVDGNAGYRCVDRFKTDIDGTGHGDFSHAQSTDVPSGQGFKFSSKLTVVTQASQRSDAGTFHQFYTMLEHQDMIHLEWGTANAKPTTLSFWVKSSVTGTYNLWMDYYASSDQKRYHTTYTINSANTWEKKIILITGPTSGGQSTNTNGIGFRLEWLMGASSVYETGTLNQWHDASETFRTAAGSVYFCENAGATWYMTGVQFEEGNVATPYEFRSFAEEFARCQRYYQQYVNISAVGYVPDNNARSYSHGFFFPVAMRAAPTMSITNTGSSNGQMVSDGDTNRFISSTLSQGSQTTHMSVSFNLSGDLANFRGAYLIGTTSTGNQTTYKINAEL